MDVGAFVQENKRWLIGAAIGGLVWWIGSGVINTIYPPNAGLERRPNTLTAAYTSSTLADAEEQSEKLAEERKRLEAELAFTASDEYVAWTGSATSHLFQVGRKLKDVIVDWGSERDVAVEEGDISWDSPTSVDSIRRVLYGLAMIDAIQQRLFAAHDATRAADEDAKGLAGILQIKLEVDRGRRGGRLSRGRRGGPDLRDLLQEQKVTLHFQADEPTIYAFLEACRQPGRTLVVDRWQQLQPARPGEPCTVKATLSGISFPKPEEDEEL